MPSHLRSRFERSICVAAFSECMANELCSASAVVGPMGGVGRQCAGYLLFLRAWRAMTASRFRLQPARPKAEVAIFSPYYSFGALAVMAGMDCPGSERRLTESSSHTNRLPNVGSSALCKAFHKAEKCELAIRQVSE